MILSKLEVKWSETQANQMNTTRKKGGILWMLNSYYVHCEEISSHSVRFHISGQSPCMGRCGVSPLPHSLPKMLKRAREEDERGIKEEEERENYYLLFKIALKLV